MMTDDSDPFAQYLTPDPQPAAPAAPSDDPFAKYLEPDNEPSGVEAFLHSAERSIAPALGGMAAAGAGAEVGALAGAPFGGVGAIPGAIIGGIGGAFLGSTAVTTAQDYALKALPESWQDFLGQDEKQQQAEQTAHPTESFLGGLLPYALTMRPGGFKGPVLPPNATAWQRIAEHPLTSRLFSGALTGGMEVGNELASGQPIDPTKVAISTGFGLVFNKTNMLGDKITEMGARPTRATATKIGLLPAPVPEGAAAKPIEAPAETPTPEPVLGEKPPDVSAKDWNEALLGQKPREPTVAQAMDAGVVGPGATEEVFMGSHQQAPEAQMTAQEAARATTPIVPTEPDVVATARRMEPEAFSEYDHLLDTRADLADRLAQVRDTEAEVQPAESAALQLQINAVDTRLREIGPDIAAAHRRAADAVGSEVIEPDLPPPPVEQNVQSVPGSKNVPASPSITPQQIEQQSAAIAEDVTRQLLASGRPEAEAHAAGQLLGRRYVTRAARLGNTVSPEVLYQSEGATIRAGGRLAAEPAGREIAQGKTLGQEAAVDWTPGGGSKTAKIGDTTVDYGVSSDGKTGEIILVKTPPAGQRQGSARAAMERVLEEADRNGTTMFLTASPMGKGASKTALRKFYKSLGFVENKGNNKDFSGPRAEFIRQPRQPRELFQPAYHGTPHIFDKFDSSKIGTGEGVQAFGHGLYFAGNKDIAKYYREALTKDTVEPAQRALKKAGDDVDTAIANAHAEIDRLNGLGLTPETGAEERDRRIASQESTIQELTAFKEHGNWKAGRLYHVEVPHDDELMVWDKPLRDQPPKVKAALEGLGFKDIPDPPKPSIDVIADPTLRRLVRDALKQDDNPNNVGLMIDNDGDLYRRALAYAKAKDGLTPEDLDERGGVGAYIETDGADQPSPNSVYGYLKAVSKRDEEIESNRQTGASIYSKLETDLGSPVAASNALRESGIPGHRFLDANSRIDEGDQTHNYVIYDDSRVNITEYEQAKRGAITFVEGRKPVIKLFKDADASTAIHETGHQWLEELMRDSVHPAATDVLKDDAQTVRDWLGIKDIGEPIQTSQHEKFARTFEQYMREGVAPSAKLARVFAQFKTWLTSIYQTIKGLGSPINEDIRSVFDRMIETEPNRTVVAPERPTSDSLAALHETDAATVQPHEAEPAMDRVISERDRYLAEQPPEVQNEIAAAEAEHQAALAATEPRPEAGAGPGGQGEVGGGGVEPEPVAPGGPGGVQSGPELGGGADAGAKGAAEPNVPAEPGTGLRDNGPGPAGAARSQPLAPDPAHIFGPEVSPFIDKAGNIRIENLTTDQDVAQAIRDAAQENNDFIGDRRGVITDGQVLDLADALGMDAEKLNRRRLGEAFNAEQVIAARKLLIQSATDVAAVMKKAATGTDEDVLAYARARARHQMIQGQVAGLTAEAGRALRAFRSLAGQDAVMGVDQFIRDATGKTLFQLKEEAKMGALLDTPEKISKFTRDASKRNFGGAVLEFWINGLVSGPRTHVTNLIGNTVMSLQALGPETAAAAAIGAVRRGLGREGPTVRMGEVGAHMRGFAGALPSATKAAIDALRTGRSITLPGEEAKPAPYESASAAAVTAGLDESAKFSDIAPDLFGVVRGVLDGLVGIGKLVATGGEAGSPLVHLKYSPLGQIPDIAIRGTTVLPTGTATRLPTRFLAAGDSFFRAANYTARKSALAYRTAAEEGLTGGAFDARVADIYQNPSTEVMEQSREAATELVFQSRRSEFVNALTRLSNVNILGFPLMKFVVPFIGTPANIIDQTVLHRTPLGFLSPEIRADILGKNGSIAQDTAMARMLVGSAYAIGFGALAARGLITGSGPADSNTQALWRLAGNQAHSVRIGDMLYDVRGLGPLGMLSGIAADMYDISHVASEGDLASVGQTLMHAFMQNILDASFMKGPSDLIQALEDPGRYGQSYLRSYASSFVPFSGAMGQTARAIDPYSRQARTVIDTIKAKVPGMSQQLWPRRDLWGEEMPSGLSLGSSILSAAYASQISKDPVNIAMASAGYWPGQPDRKIRGVQLTDEQYDLYSQVAGRTTKQRLNQIVGSAQWNTWPANVRHDVIQETIRQSREAARGMVMTRWPSIIRDATNLKLAPLQGK